MEPTIESIQEFWNDNPLFSGESKFEPGTIEFFEDHKNIYYKDCFAGSFNEKLFLPTLPENAKILDLGCGIGFWTIELSQRIPDATMYSADLTQNALDITEKRLKTYKLSAELSIQNAEQMSFEDNFFDHVNCQGVIHHTPDTNAAIKEIARVLKKDGTAYISVYYKNVFLRNWKKISSVGKLISKAGGGLKGRGREKIFDEKDPNEITRLYDGDENPLGKAYSKKEIKAMVQAYFEVLDVSTFFFPARAMPVKVPKFFHRFLARKFGFMIHLQLRKK